jgi:exosome complex RNA-binding protein Csl4
MFFRPACRGPALAAVLSPLVLALAGCASNHASRPNGSAGAIQVDGLTAIATVQSVDTVRRTVTLRWENGRVAAYKAGRDGVHLDQIRPGDTVKASIVESMALWIGPAGATGSDSQSSTVALAPSGDKSGVLDASTFVITDRVVAIDRKTRTITFEGLAGVPRTIRATAGIDLSSINIGDTIVARVTEALAICVAEP